MDFVTIPAKIIGYLDIVLNKLAELLVYVQGMLPVDIALFKVIFAVGVAFLINTKIHDDLTRTAIYAVLILGLLQGIL